MKRLLLIVAMAVMAGTVKAEDIACTNRWPESMQSKATNAAIGSNTRYYLLYKMETFTTTNTYQPTQYWNDSSSCSVLGFQQKTRLNPDVKFIEIRTIRQLKFTFEGKEYIEILDDKEISKTKYIRRTTEEWEIVK